MWKRLEWLAVRSSVIGGKRVLDCDTEQHGLQHSSEVIMTWKRQDDPLPIFIQFNEYPPHIHELYKGRLRLVESLAIEISDLRSYDEGWYECTVQTLDGSTIEERAVAINGSWLYLAVNAPPVLGHVSPSFLVHKHGDSVELFCDATASPEPVVTWLKDNRVLIPTDRLIVRESRVQIRHVTQSDGGAYTCSFKNIVGNISHTIKLVIEEAGKVTTTTGNAYIMLPPENTTTREGDRVKFNCQAEGHPNNITYRWLRNNIDTQHIVGLALRSMIYADGSLVITSASKEDSGWYVCRPSNGLGPPPEAKAYLDVTYLPRVHSLPATHYLPRGFTGYLDCPVDANPPATRIDWAKDDRTIDVNTTFKLTSSVASRLIVRQLGSLLIHNVETVDEGRYTCTPFSTLGFGHVSSPVQVLVRDPPQFLVRPDAVYQRQADESVVVSCLADGDPLPTITWRKDGKMLPLSERIDETHGNLTITRLNRDDCGIYECVATNVVASVVSSALLIIEVSTTHAAYNFTVEVTSYSARLSWLPAFSNGDVQHYVVWYRELERDGNTWHTIHVIPHNTMSVTIHPLEPATSYQFMILARNVAGNGLFSVPVNATTYPATDNDIDDNIVQHLPSSSPALTVTEPIKVVRCLLPPAKIIVLWIRSSVLISWHHPAQQCNQSNEVRSRVAEYHYIIQYRTVGHWAQLVVTPINVTSYNWTTASRGATYHFRLLTMTSLNHSDVYSKPSEIVSIQTTDIHSERLSVSSSVVGAFVGLLLVLFLATLSLVVVAKFFVRQKQLEKSARYGNIKYFGPNQSPGILHNGQQPQCVPTASHAATVGNILQNPTQPPPTIVANNQHAAAVTCNKPLKETPI